MDWHSADALMTINGLHITLWVLAYCAWRYLTSPRWAQRAQATEDARGERSRRRSHAASVPVADRMERRAQMLAKMQRPGRAPSEHRELRRRKAA